MQRSEIEILEAAIEVKIRTADEKNQNLVELTCDTPTMLFVKKQAVSTKLIPLPLFILSIR